MLRGLIHLHEDLQREDRKERKLNGRLDVDLPRVSIVAFQAAREADARREDDQPVPSTE